MKFPILLPNIFNYPFTYESDIELKIGDFVEVPFGKSKITGESKNVEYYGYWEWKDGKIIATGGILDPTWYGGEIVRYLESQK